MKKMNSYLIMLFMYSFMVFQLRAACKQIKEVDSASTCFVSDCHHFYEGPTECKRAQCKCAPGYCAERLSTDQLPMRAKCVKEQKQQSTNYETEITDYETQITDYGTKITDYETQITDYETEITDYGTKITDYETQITDYETQIMKLYKNYETKITNYKTQITEKNREINNYTVVIKDEGSNSNDCAMHLSAEACEYYAKNTHDLQWNGIWHVSNGGENYPKGCFVGSGTDVWFNYIKSEGGTQPLARPICRVELPDKGRSYRGYQNKTRSGYTCQNWTSQSTTSKKYPGFGLGDHNYCRNPDNGDTIWCYTTNPDKRMEFCDPI